MNETYELVHLPQWLKHRLHYHDLGAVLLLAEEAKEDPMIGLQPTLGNLVIDNLLQNAKRYGDGNVTVTLRQVEHF